VTATPVSEMTEVVDGPIPSVPPVNGALSQVLVGRSVDPTLAVWFDGRLRLPPVALDRRSMLELLDDWDAGLAAVDASLFEGSTEPAVVLDAHLVAPLTYPGAVICAGANYVDHLEEMGIARPVVPPPPFFFLKPPRTTVIGDQAPIPMPAGNDIRLDWEGELAVVIAHRVRDVAADQVADHIAGYTIANDISARGPFRRAAPLGPPFAFDWLGHKGQDGSCPIGPALVPAHLIEDPQNLRILTHVNGELVQDSSTAEMYVPIAELVAAASQTMTLSPGDVILTGTPAGVGSARGRFLAVGDQVSVSIDGLGTLTNHIVR
jgi:2-keto-4-pentenoate hydratase/2-oxohepta-3-ene-1,7-dioic acid hydratase in catechol pathway